MTDDALDRLKASSREAWGKAEEYRLLGERLEPAAEALIAACAIEPGMRVLDVAAGDGNAALYACRAGADVVASDFAPAQVEAGRERTSKAGFDAIEWIEADAEELPFEDGSFDCVVSVFGAQFAPRPERVASELFRVVRAGGTVGMANWPNRGFQAGVFAIMSKYRDDEPAGVPPSGLWGDEPTVRERFEPYAESVSVEVRMLPFRFASFEQMGTCFQRGAPRQADTIAKLSEERRQEMAADFGALIGEHNRADDGSVAIDAEYAIVVARKKS